MLVWTNIKHGFTQTEKQNLRNDRVMELQTRDGNILFGLAFVDNGFLVALLAIGLKELGVNIFDKYESGCQLIVYFSYVFSFLSAW